MSKIHILWTTGEKEVAMKVVLPYLFQGKANGWWDDMNLVVWGPSVRLLATDREIQLLVQDVIDSGIPVEVCRLCADTYGVFDVLSLMEVNIRYVGAPLTEYLKSDDKVITF